MRTLILIIAGTVLAACATASTGAMSEKAAAKLAQFDRTGEIKNCLGIRQISSIDALDDRHFLVRAGSQYYLNVTGGRCSNAGRAGYYLQYSTSLSQLCRNEIIRVVDNSSGITAGSCGLGSFERLEKKPAE